jgi:hypothetical protein
MPGRPPREVPDRRVGGMSEAPKGEGKLHKLHEGEIVLNRATTRTLLSRLGISKETASKMAPGTLMKRVKEAVTNPIETAKKAGEAIGKGAKRVVDATKRGVERKKKILSRQTGGMARPVRATPSREKGGMARPARATPSRLKGGMSASDQRAERDKRLGRMPQYDTL